MRLYSPVNCRAIWKSNDTTTMFRYYRYRAWLAQTLWVCNRYVNCAPGAQTYKARSARARVAQDSWFSPAVFPAARGHGRAAHAASRWKSRNTEQRVLRYFPASQKARSTCPDLPRCSVSGCSLSGCASHAILSAGAFTYRTCTWVALSHPLVCASLSRQFSGRMRE